VRYIERAGHFENISGWTKSLDAKRPLLKEGVVIGISDDRIEVEYMQTAPGRVLLVAATCILVRLVLRLLLRSRILANEAWAIA
jgi:hypothetical protein